jgi:hypothetical protein
VSERNALLDGRRERIERVELADAVEFTRIAQLHAEVDALKKSRDRTATAT